MERSILGAFFSRLTLPVHYGLIFSAGRDLTCGLTGNLAISFPSSPGELVLSSDSLLLVWTPSVERTRQDGPSVFGSFVSSRPFRSCCFFLLSQVLFSPRSEVLKEVSHSVLYQVCETFEIGPLDPGDTVNSGFPFLTASDCATRTPRHLHFFCSPRPRGTIRSFFVVVLIWDAFQEGRSFLYLCTTLC